MYRNKKCSGFLVKILELFLRHPMLALAYKGELGCGLTR
jgi:hypothetical protein